MANLDLSLVLHKNHRPCASLAGCGPTCTCALEWPFILRIAHRGLWLPVVGTVVILKRRPAWCDKDHSVLCAVVRTAEASAQRIDKIRRSSEHSGTIALQSAGRVSRLPAQTGAERPDFDRFGRSAKGRRRRPATGEMHYLLIFRSIKDNASIAIAARSK